MAAILLAFAPVFKYWPCAPLPKHIKAPSTDWVATHHWGYESETSRAGLDLSLIPPMGQTIKRGTTAYVEVVRRKPSKSSWYTTARFDGRVVADFSSFFPWGFHGPDEWPLEGDYAVYWSVGTQVRDRFIVMADMTFGATRLERLRAHAGQKLRRVADGINLDDPAG
jgi:hypothetical protein